MKTYKLKILATAVTLSLLSLVNTDKIQACVTEDGNFEISIRVKSRENAESVLNGTSAIGQAKVEVEKTVDAIVKSFEKSLNQAHVLAERGFQKTFEIGSTQRVLTKTNKHAVKVQLVANKAFDGDVKLIAYDKNQREIGRTNCNVSYMVDESIFLDFSFRDQLAVNLACYYSISC